MFRVLLLTAEKHWNLEGIEIKETNTQWPRRNASIKLHPRLNYIRESLPGHGQ
jgi:hypothetical protein